MLGKKVIGKKMCVKGQKKILGQKRFVKIGSVTADILLIWTNVVWTNFTLTAVLDCQ